MAKAAAHVFQTWSRTVPTSRSSSRAALFAPVCSFFSFDEASTSSTEVCRRPRLGCSGACPEPAIFSDRILDFLFFAKKLKPTRRNKNYYNKIM